MSRVPFESVHGYKIIEAVAFDSERGFALGANPKAAFPFATWQFTDHGGKREMCYGHYYLREDTDVARLDYGERIKSYLRENPEVREQYNYLAAAEMGEEQNYNAIDGIINNVQKPSILEHLRQFQPKPHEQGDAPDRTTEIQR